MSLSYVLVRCRDCGTKRVEIMHRYLPCPSCHRSREAGVDAIGFDETGFLVIWEESEDEQ